MSISIPPFETLSLSGLKKSTLKSTTPPTFPFDDAEVLTASEANIVKAIKTAPLVFAGGWNQDKRKVVRLSENTVAKYGEFVTLAEARNMKFVRKNAPSVRLPTCIRSIQVKEEKHTVTYIVMEYIHGTPLSDCWEGMSKDRRQNICDQVVDSIFQLQTLQLKKPGPIGGGTSRSPTDLFSLYGAGPFNSIRELEDWYSHRMYCCKRFRMLPPDTPSFEGTFGDHMVMSHLDIVRRNIIVQADDLICLIDWEFAGAYPAHFERRELERQRDRDRDFTDRILARLPKYKNEIDKLNSIAFALANVGN